MECYMIYITLELIKKYLLLICKEVHSDFAKDWCRAAHTSSNTYIPTKGG